MPVYLHPGVYVEEIPSGSKPIEAVGTSTAAFVGFTTKGPLDAPTLITSFDDYERLYGGIRDLGSAAEGDPMGFSAAAFFLNGGTKAYIHRVATGATTATANLPDFSPPEDFLELTAVNAGEWANGLVVRVTPKDGAGDLHTVEIGRYAVAGDDTSDFNGLESFSDVSLDESSPRFIEGVVNGVSENVTVEVIFSSPPFDIITSPPSEATLEGGADGSDAPLDGVGSELGYSEVFTAFLKIRDINILCLPDHPWDSLGDQVIVQAAIAHAETTKSRMVIVDPPSGGGSELTQEADVTGLSLPTQTYGVLYYPWVKVANPFFDEERNPGVPVTLRVPPCGYAAGMWSKIDGRRGVWKAPAGVETGLLGLAGLEHTVEDAEQDFLNPLGVNALRTLPGYGRVIWGSRTLSTKADPEWRYVPVRRTAIFIGESIYNGIQWAVFEPNSHQLWSSLRSNVGSFMDGLFRSGAFQGEKASAAYFVRCGLGDTMTQGDIDRGQVIVIVGFAPLKPAEFVIVRIQQKVAQQ